MAEYSDILRNSSKTKYSALCVIRTRKIHENWVELYQNQTTEGERTDRYTQCTKALPMGDNGGSVAILH